MRALRSALLGLTLVLASLAAGCTPGGSGPTTPPAASTPPGGAPAAPSAEPSGGRGGIDY